MDDAKLQLLIDRAEIGDVQLRYATGLDSRDWTLFRSCFTDEIGATRSRQVESTEVSHCGTSSVQFFA